MTCNGLAGQFCASAAIISDESESEDTVKRTMGLMTGSLQFIGQLKSGCGELRANRGGMAADVQYRMALALYAVSA